MNMWQLFHAFFFKFFLTVIYNNLNFLEPTFIFKIFWWLKYFLFKVFFVFKIVILLLNLFIF